MNKFRLLIVKILILSCSFSVPFLQGCDNKKERAPSKETTEESAVLIGKSIEHCERHLGDPKRFHRGVPEARSYLHRGLHVQVSYERGESTAVVFRKAVPVGSAPKRLSDSDRELIFKMCGTRSDDLDLLLEHDSDKLQTFNGLGDGQSYLLTTDNKIHAMVVVPNTEATWKAMREMLEK